MDGDIDALRADPSGDRRPRASSEIVDHYDRDRRGARRARRSSWATPSAARSRRSCSTAGSAPPAWRSTRRRSRACIALPAVDAQVRLAGPQEPGQPPPRGDAHAGGVPLRVHQHAHRGGVGARSTSATPCPGPGRVLFQAALANFNPHAATAVDFKNDDRAPLLLIAGGEDHIVPAVGRQVERQALRQVAPRSPSTRSSPAARTTRSARTGWEEVADYALEWAVSHARMGAAV